MHIPDKPRVSVVHAPIPRLDISALLAATDHVLSKCEGGFRCSRCTVIVTRGQLRKGDNALCVPPDALFLGPDGLPVPPPLGHPECARLAARFGFDPSQDLLSRFEGGVICWTCGCFSQSQRAQG